jgi:RNA polymerase sigma factor (TIGR02999 family)
MAGSSRGRERTVLDRRAIDSDAVYQAAYAQLHRLARSERRGRRSGETVNTTALVHEAWLKLRNHPQLAGLSRGQFLALSARAMRQILVDCARRQAAEKRRHISVLLDDDIEDTNSTPVDALALEALMTQLEAIDPMLARVVDLHVFGGFSFSDIADSEGLSERSTYRLWRKARVFLLDQLQP